MHFTKLVCRLGLAIAVVASIEEVSGQAAAKGSSKSTGTPDGDWSGTTSQGKPIKFSIVAGKVKTLTVTIKASSDSCSTETTKTIGNLAISSDGKFLHSERTQGAMESGSFELKGTIDDRSASASGSIAFAMSSSGPIGVPGLPQTSCHATATATWKAQK